MYIHDDSLEMLELNRLYLWQMGNDKANVIAKFLNLYKKEPEWYIEDDEYANLFDDISNVDWKNFRNFNNEEVNYWYSLVSKWLKNHNITYKEPRV